MITLRRAGCCRPRVAAGYWTNSVFLDLVLDWPFNQSDFLHVLAIMTGAWALSLVRAPSGKRFHVTTSRESSEPQRKFRNWQEGANPQWEANLPWWRGSSACGDRPPFHEPGTRRALPDDPTAATITTSDQYHYDFVPEFKLQLNHIWVVKQTGCTSLCATA